MYSVLEGRPAGWRPLGRPRCSQEANSKLGAKEIGWGSWILYMAQGRAECGAVVHTGVNLRVL
jgi:hypothetical protein